MASRFHCGIRLINAFSKDQCRAGAVLLVRSVQMHYRLRKPPAMAAELIPSPFETIIAILIAARERCS
jgi:hypothetical protein